MSGKRKKIGRNEPCPCGTGKKYKSCCYDKAFNWVTAEDGSIAREVPLSDKSRELLQAQVERFKEKFGREPGPEDKLFWEEPEHVEHQVTQAMRRAGLPPAMVYAYEKTGLLVTEKNRNLIPEADLAEWNAAWDEYEKLHPND